MADPIPRAVILTGTLAQTTIAVGQSILYSLYIPTALVSAASVAGFTNLSGTPVGLPLPVGTQGIVDLSAGRGVVVPQDLKITLGNVADLIQVIYEV